MNIYLRSKTPANENSQSVSFHYSDYREILVPIFPVAVHVGMRIVRDDSFRYYIFKKYSSSRFSSFPPPHLPVFQNSKPIS